MLGIVSLNDIVRAAGQRKPVREGDVLTVLQAISAHHSPVPHVEAA